MRRYAQGSKDVVRTVGTRVKKVGSSRYLNQKSVADLRALRKTMEETPVKVDDLQFLIGKDGSMVIADPLKVVVGAKPSEKNRDTIRLLIKLAGATHD